MSEASSPVTKHSSSTTMRLALVLLIAAAVVYLLAANFSKLGAVLLVLFGFGGVIMVHEFGHFIFGKMTGMKVEAFSIGFSPVVLGIRRTNMGFHVRVLPTLVPKEGGLEGEGALDFTFGAGGREWDTEYRIGLIPFGGFVALLGQEDVGVAEQTSDPRSFTNKPLLSRIVVIMAGVTFNVISALVIFMIIFHNGIQLQAPVIGEVVVNSPAEKAHLQPGDEVLSLNGDSFIDFSNLTLAGALSHKGEAVNMLVKRTAADGTATTLPVSIVPESGKGPGMLKFVRLFGIGPASTLRIARLSDANDRKDLLEKTGLMEKDTVVAVDGRTVKDGIEFANMMDHALKRDVVLTVSRTDAKTGQVTRHDTRLGLAFSMVTPDFEKDFTLNSVFGMVPRLKVAKLPPEPKTFTEKGRAWVHGLLYGKKERLLMKDDVIVKVGDCEYPTFTDLRQVMTGYTNAAISHRKEGKDWAGRKIDVVVERVIGGQLQQVTLKMEPELPDEANVPSILGFSAGLDDTSPAIAKVIPAENGFEPGAIPAGATVVSVGGEKVSSFFDIVAALRRNADTKTELAWQMGDKKGVVSFAVPLNMAGMTMTSGLVDAVPFDELRRSYKASNPAQAIVMGWKRTELFITQAVLTVQRLISGALSPSTLSGPLGIVTATYKIAAEKGLAYYFYWLALISASIAVMNLLPLPVLDGGVIVLMLIEKIKGSPLSSKTVGIINYAGLALLAFLMLYVTMNDIKMFF
jgi:regulator of sigma E protease